MRKEFDKPICRVNFALVSREHALAISFVIDDDILYVVSESDIMVYYQKEYWKLFMHKI